MWDRIWMMETYYFAESPQRKTAWSVLCQPVTWLVITLSTTEAWFVFRVEASVSVPPRSFRLWGTLTWKPTTSNEMLGSFLNTAALQKFCTLRKILISVTLITEVQRSMHVVPVPLGDGRSMGGQSVCSDLTKIDVWSCRASTEARNEDLDTGRVAGQLWVLWAVTSNVSSRTKTNFLFYLPTLLWMSF